MTGGSAPSILPTMLGGSAPSQASGAPFRTGSGNRAAVWPQPAHQGDIFNRGYGIYSLFPGPGDAAKTLYTPNAKTPHLGSPFQNFMGTQKVPETFFPTKFPYGTNGTPQFNPALHPEIERKISRLDLTPKTFSHDSKPYSPTVKKSQEQDANMRKESRPKRLSDDVVIIKSEVEEPSKGQNKSAAEDEEEEDVFGKGKKLDGGNSDVPVGSDNVRAEGALANEPDSTEFKTSDEARRTEGDVTTSEVEGSDKDPRVSEVDENLMKELKKSVNNFESFENEISKEKCNIKVIDLSGDGSGKGTNRKAGDKCPVKVESINEICNRLTEKKYVKAKTADAGWKGLTVNCKKSNETSKPSPTRTLSLPPHNGGCSRTTPVTFKHSPQQEPDPKPQPLNLEVPPLVIKKEPPDFQKYPNGPPFLSPAPLDNFFSPGGLRVLDGQLLSPVPYSDSFESSARRKESFLSPTLPHSFLSPSQSFLSPRPVSESPFLSPGADIGEFNACKTYRTLPKMGEGFLAEENMPKVPEGLFLGTAKEEERNTHDGRLFINSTTSDVETKTDSCNSANGTPCQVAEVTSASSLLSPQLPPLNPLVVKQEAVSTAPGSAPLIGTADSKKEVNYMPSGQSAMVSSTVGAAMTRQRCQQRVAEMKIPSNEVPSPPVLHRTVQSPASIDLPSPMGAPAYNGGLPCEDRAANLITTWPTQPHNPTLWQYSAPIDYPPFPPVGFQLVRDPITGHFLLIPASNIEALQRAILWPSYQPTPPQMIIPPISVQPTTPHLLLDSNVPAVDFLAPEAIHHSSPQPRILIATDNASKRKLATPTLIKLEASDCSNTVVVATCDKNNIFAKAQSTTLPPVSDPAFYSKRSAGPIENGRRSQATSPAPCLPVISENQPNSTEPADPQTNPCQPPTTTTVTLQDASNQTDMPMETGSGNSQSSAACRDKFEPYTKVTGQNLKMPKTQDVGTETEAVGEPEDDKQTVLREIEKRKEAEKSLNIEISNVPDVNIKKEIISPSQVDLSGLELLSNSIEQFVCVGKSKNSEADSKEAMRNCVMDGERKDLSNDACEGAVLLQNLRNGFREVDKSEMYESENSKNLGGLGLLCALAEQRFHEEIGKEVSDKGNIESQEEEEDEEEEEEDEEDEEGEEAEEDLKEEKDEKVSDVKPYSGDPKDCDMNRNYQSDSGNLPEIKKEVETIEKVPEKCPDILKPSKISRDRDNKDNKEDLGDALVPDCNSVAKRGPGRPKKPKNVVDSHEAKSTYSRRASRKSKEMSPPVLEKETDYPYAENNDVSDDSQTLKSKIDILKPPTLTPSTTLEVPGPKNVPDAYELPPCEVNLVPIKIGQIKKADEGEGEAKKRKSSDTGSDVSSSKKRKVGRPKKHHLLHENPLTETIVAKKPKTKPSYLFRPIQSVENSNCLKTKNPEIPLCEGEKKKSSSVKPEKGAMDVNSENEEKKPRKIRPKLKAEPKLREWIPLQDEDSLEWRKSAKKEENGKQKMKVQKKIVVDAEKVNGSSGAKGPKESKSQNCVLTTEDLKNDKVPIRTLTVMGGLFYAGQLSAIRAPDVYGITIDGERGNRPHIYSREEILKDSILEVKPEKTSNLLPGTRCCAYWSEQYRCLYPGTVSVPASPDPELDDRFVNVEFDDGDSGRINIDDIRLLPEDYPIVEYDPNPLQSLSKRKRRISGASVESHSKERKSVDSLPSFEKSEAAGDKITKAESISDETEPKKLIQIYEPGTFLSLESERRHLKKKRREKLKRLQSLSFDGKKKHKKHRCSDEHRHHRHHKKHRKHKHKHGKRHGSETSGEMKIREEKAEEGTNKEKTEVTAKKKSIKCKSAEKSSKVSEKSKAIKPKKCKERTESVESRSKMAAFLPARQLWGWSGKGYRRPGAKGRARKEFYKTIQRGKERITVGDCAVFLSTGRPDRPYIGKIESMWESWGTNMIVRVKWFYHPEETVGCPATLEYPGALFESPHVDENDVQTISHKCEVLPLKDYTAKIGNEPHRYETIYDNNDIYYLAGYYDPTNTTLKMEPGVK